MSLVFPPYDTNPSLIGRIARWRSLLTLVILGTVTLAATEQASASCGSYLYRNGKPVSGHSMQVGPLNSVQTDASTSSSLPLELPARRCSGPNCSSSPLPLAPAPVPPSNLIRGFEQAIFESLMQTPRGRDGITVPESERGARFEPSTIFRPPAV